MQNQISDLFQNLFSNNLGMTDPTSVFGLCLALPGVAMFVILFFGRELMRPRWRGYWDAV
jgi:hypothetical protein